METTIDQQLSRRSTRSDQASKAKIWTGRVMIGLPLLFLALDGVMKFTNLPEVVEGSEKIGFSKATLPFIGGIELLAVLLVSIPRTPSPVSGVGHLLRPDNEGERSGGAAAPGVVTGTWPLRRGPPLPALALL
jgi:DoxX-like family